MSTKRVIQWTFGVLGFLLFAGAFYMYREARSLVDRAVKVPGKVISNVTTVDSEGSDMYYPSFQFKTLDGHEITAVGKNGASSPDYQPGEAVDVLYEDADPSAAQIRSFTQLWIGPVVVGSISGCFLGVWMILFFVKTGRSRSRL